MLKRRKIKKNGNNDGADFRKVHSFKELECSKCAKPVQVDSQTESVVCWHCTAMSVAPPDLKPVFKKAEGPKKPKGWHFMKVFVDSEGNVFHEGVEQPALKGTLPATAIKAKKTHAQKDAEKLKKEAKLAKLYEKKKKLKEKENGNKQISLGSDNLQENSKKESVHSS